MSNTLTSLLDEFVYDTDIVDEDARRQNEHAIFVAYFQGRVDGAFACEVCGMRADWPWTAMECCLGLEDHLTEETE